MSKTKPKNYWTYDRCKEIALKYNFRSDFLKNDNGAYQKAFKNKWLDEICKHMDVVGNYSKRLVYVHLFNDNSAYVGITYNIEKRQRNRNSNPNDQVTKHINETGIQPERIILTDYIDTNDAIELEEYYVNKYREDGWFILNKVKTGSIGGNIIKWTKERCKEEALKYNSRTDFNKYSSGAYYASKRNGWFDDIVKHMQYNERKSKNYWTKEKCKDIASLCKNVKELITRSETAYTLIRKNKWFDELCSHFILDKKPFGYWNYETCKEVAMKYKNKTDFFTKDNGAYDKARTNGWLDDICSHMDLLKHNSGYWNYENCKNEALKYSSRLEFSQYNGSAYNSAKKNGWLDDILPNNAYNVNKTYGYWNYVNCKNEANKYENRSSFKIYSSGAYKASNINGWLNDFYPVCKTKNGDDFKYTNYWNYDTCKEESLRYKNRTEFCKKSKGAYDKARYNNWLDDFYPKNKSNK